jgi:hypothetical protein
MRGAFVVLAWCAGTAAIASVAGCQNDSVGANSVDAGGDAAAAGGAPSLHGPRDAADKMDGGPAADAGKANGSSGRSPDASTPTVDSGVDAEAEVDAGADDADAGAACGNVGGPYSVIYTEISGTCGPINSANTVKIDNTITMEKYVNVDVDTETIVRDCRVLIQGNALRVDADGNVAGTVTLTRYNTAGDLSCTGEYEAAFTKVAQ